MLMVIGCFLSAVIALLLMLAGGGELMGMLIVRVRLADNAVAASRFRFHSGYTSGGQQRGLSKIGSVR